MIIDYELGERVKLTDCPNHQLQYKYSLASSLIQVASDECRKCKYFDYFIRDNQVCCNYQTQ